MKSNSTFWLLVSVVVANTLLLTGSAAGHSCGALRVIVVGGPMLNAVFFFTGLGFFWGRRQTMANGAIALMACAVAALVLDWLAWNSLHFSRC